jgi:hypothetical protein
LEIAAARPTDLVQAVEIVGLANGDLRLLDLNSQPALESLVFELDVVKDVLTGVASCCVWRSVVEEKLVRLILLRRMRLPEESDDRFVSRLFSLLWFSLAPVAGTRTAVPTGQIQRLKCSATGAVGSCYMLLDAQEILLVRPDEQRVEEAKPLMVRGIGGVRECRIENDTTLVICTAEDLEPLRLVFEDARRSHIALMHVETRKAELVEELGRTMLTELVNEYKLNQFSSCSLFCF